MNELNWLIDFIYFICLFNYPEINHTGTYSICKLNTERPTALPSCPDSLIIN